MIAVTGLGIGLCTTGVIGLFVARTDRWASFFAGLTLAACLIVPALCAVELAR